MSAVVELIRDLIRAPRSEFARGVLLLALIAVIVVCLAMLLS